MRSRVRGSGASRYPFPLMSRAIQARWPACRGRASPVGIWLVLSRSEARNGKITRRGVGSGGLEPRDAEVEESLLIGVSRGDDLPVRLDGHRPCPVGRPEAAS